MTFYSNNGNPVFYSDDNEHIFDFNGKALGYFYNESVYNYNGKHLGWFDNGWIIDHSGKYTFFNENATGGPLKPLKALTPLKGLKELKPLKSLKEMRPMKSMKSLSWSKLNVKEFFKLR